MDVVGIFEKCCTKEDEGYLCEIKGRIFEIIPATEEQIASFRKNCDEREVPEKIKEELTDYYRQNNSFFNYFTCDDVGIFEWWDDYRELWLGCIDMDVYRYSTEKGKYTIGDAGDPSYGEEFEFDSIEEMLVAALGG